MVMGERNEASDSSG